MQKQGVIIRWDDNKGFGFIKAVNGQEYFFHVSAFKENKLRPTVGLTVCFLLGKDKNGREQALSVESLVKAKLRSQYKKGRAWQAQKALMIALAALLTVAGLCFFADLPLLILVFYILASVLSFLFYLWDKASAKKGNWRTPEARLHMLSLLGGWPGALFAQQLLRHKTVKAEFRAVFWLTVMVNISALGFLVSPYGAEYRAQLQGLSVPELGLPVLPTKPKATIEWSQ